MPLKIPKRLPSKPTNKDLAKSAEEIIGFFSGLLSLRDWTIHVRIQDPSNLPDAYGEIMPSVKLKRAIMNLKPLTERDMMDKFDDYEQTIIHELLHLHWAFMLDMKMNKTQEALFEQAIELTARAMKHQIELYRDLEERYISEKGLNTGLLTALADLKEKEGEK